MRVGAAEDVYILYCKLLEQETHAIALACATVAFYAEETILVSFLVAEEGGPSKCTRWLV